MAFCSKCGAKLSEGTKFCASCGTAVSAPDNGNAPQAQSPVTDITANVTQVAKQFSLTPKLLAAALGFALLFLYYLFNYLGPWRLSFWTFLNNLLVPALFVGLILTQARAGGKYFYFSAPLCLRALCCLYFMLRNLNAVSFQNGIIWLAHIALAVLFILTVIGKFDGKKIILGIAAAVGVFAAVMSFRSSFISGLMQIIYFGSLFILVMELNLPTANTKGGIYSNKVG